MIEVAGSLAYDLLQFYLAWVAGQYLLIAEPLPFVRDPYKDKTTGLPIQEAECFRSGFWSRYYGCMGTGVEIDKIGGELGGLRKLLQDLVTPQLSVVQATVTAQGKEIQAVEARLMEQFRFSERT